MPCFRQFLPHFCPPPAPLLPNSAPFCLTSAHLCPSHEPSFLCAFVPCQVYGFRNSLWAEHLGEAAPTLSTPPSSLQCMRAVNKAADANWKQYSAPEVTDMEAHLVAYPLLIGRDGSVGPIPGFEEFPDLGGLTVGKHQMLPEALTT